jgi:hypothetical protein
MKSLEKFMRQAMEHLDQGKLSVREDGAIVYDAPCRCGDPYCGDELVLSPNKDRLLWSRWWGSLDFYDRWAFDEEGNVEYLGTVTEQAGVRYPPVMPE